jgi:hypothetical protein
MMKKNVGFVMKPCPVFACPVFAMTQMLLSILPMRLVKQCVLTVISMNKKVDNGALVENGVMVSFV